MRRLGTAAALVVLLTAWRGPTSRAADDPAAPPARSAAARPNIIFILADDLGYGDLGCYGQRKVKTPNLDRLAADGLRFTQFYAGSTVCAPSRCVLMTGLHTGHCTVRGNAPVPLRAEDVTVAEVLKKAGYATAIVGKWGLGQPGSAAVPTKQGFDSFFGYYDQTHAHNYYPPFLWRDEEKVPLKNEQEPTTRPSAKLGAGVASKKVEYSHDLFTAEALKFVEAHAPEKAPHDGQDGGKDAGKDAGGPPFFLYLAYTIPHANNEAAPRGLEVPDQGPYKAEPWPEQEKNKAAMISRLDADVGRMRDLLKRRGVDDNTIVFFASDNGPHKEGGIDPAFFGSSGPLRGIKRDVYEGGVRVPMIARWPGHTKPGTTSDHVGSFQDFLATAAELAGADAPATDGISLVPSVLGRPDEQRRHDYLYWEFYEGPGAQGVRFDGDWKAVRKPLERGKTELYDLKSDLAEQHDVAADHADLVARAEAIMKAAHAPSPDFRLPSEGGGTTRPAAAARRPRARPAGAE